MRENTPCFNGFIKMLEKRDYILTYEVDDEGDIHWFNSFITEQALTYSRAWNDSTKFYNSFK